MGLLEWSIVDTPDSVPSVIKEILNPDGKGIGIIKIALANDGNTIWAIVRRGDRNGINQGGAQTVLYKSSNGGRSWGDSSYQNLDRLQSDIPNDTLIWNMAIAPDNPNIIAVVCSNIEKSPILQEVWISLDSGETWENTLWSFNSVGNNTPYKFISAIDIAREATNKKIIIGTRDGQGDRDNNIQILTISTGTWKIQNLSDTQSKNSFSGDILTARFSPNFAVDSTIAVVYTDHRGTWLTTGNYDPVMNGTVWQPQTSHVEIRNANGHPEDSPRINEIIDVSLELPMDFLGNNQNSRIFYISTNAIDRIKGISPNRGIYRVNNNIIHTLMDNTRTFGFVNSNSLTRRISSIAYWGTTTLGKLLAGEVLGTATKANTSLWFTDTPTESSSIIWYPSKKTPSGAAGNLPGRNDKLDTVYGYGNVQIVWSPVYADQGVAYASTCSACLGPWKIPNISKGAIENDNAWPAGYMKVLPYDESAFSLTRNNGETWNQLSLINTQISKLTDVAVAKDCTTIYLASTNENSGFEGFESIWRSSTNKLVVSPPLPALPIGTIWERVRVTPSNTDCNLLCSKWSILRLAPDRQDGQIIFWGAGGTSSLSNIGGYPVGPNTKAVAWSPDYGDYWGDMVTDLEIQDFGAESSTCIYILDISGKVQKIIFTGTEWANSNKIVSTHLKGGHTIEATGLGRIIVGNSLNRNSLLASSVSTDSGKTFRPFSRFIPGESIKVGFHAIFDTDFENNATIYVASDMSTLTGTPSTSSGTIYRNKFPIGAGADWEDMCNNGTEHREFYGIAQTNSKNVSGQGTLYATHKPINNINTGVERTIRPLDGIPIPGIRWDCLNVINPQNNNFDLPKFTLEPKGLKICGCFTADTNVTLYAIDNDWYAGNHNISNRQEGIQKIRNRGMLWSYTDCVAKIGPKLTMDDGTTIKYDIQTSKIKSIDFTWEQLTIATHYQIQIAKDKGFSLIIADLADILPYRLALPSLIYFPEEKQTSPITSIVPNLELDNTYYWRCRVVKASNGQKIFSPWSDVRKFTIGSIKKDSIPKSGSRTLTSSNAGEIEIQKNADQEYDAFVIHASKDEGFVKQLVRLLAEKHLKIWYAPFSIDSGENIHQAVNNGLLKSRYGIVVLSKNFYERRFPQDELGALYNLERDFKGNRPIFIWYNINYRELMQFDPITGGRNSKYKCPPMNLNEIADEISQEISRLGNPLNKNSKKLSIHSRIQKFIVDFYKATAEAWFKAHG